MLLSELISSSEKNKKKIKQEYIILQEFQKKNPWLVLKVLEQMSEEGQVNIPSFDDVISFKEDFLLDDLSKVFKQIKKHNPLLINKTESEKVYFYMTKEGFYNSQLKKGFKLGDRDVKGHLVTGSNLLIEVASVNLKEFLEMYYTKNN